MINVAQTAAIVAAIGIIIFLTVRIIRTLRKSDTFPGLDKLTIATAKQLIDDIIESRVVFINQTFAEKYKQENGDIDDETASQLERTIIEYMENSSILKFIYKKIGIDQEYESYIYDMIQVFVNKHKEDHILSTKLENFEEDSTVAVYQPNIAKLEPEIVNNFVYFKDIDFRKGILTKNERDICEIIQNCIEITTSLNQQNE